MLMSKKMFEILKGGESVSKLLYHQIAKMHRTMPSTVNASLNLQKYRNTQVSHMPVVEQLGQVDILNGPCLRPYMPS